jgi:hypothetical protein
MMKVRNFLGLSYSGSEVVSAALAFANLRGSLRLKKNIAQIRRLRIYRNKLESLPKLKSSHKWLVEMLSGLANKKGANKNPTLFTLKGRPLFDRLQWALADVLVVTVPRVEGRKYISSDDLIVVDSVEGLCAYALALIATGKKRQGKRDRRGYYRVAQCKWHECGKFFLPASKGGRYPEYCCAKCRATADGQ